MMPVRKITTTEWLVLAGSVLFTLILFVIFAQRVPVETTGLAFDWKIFWNAIRNGNVQWVGHMRTPPWSIIFLIPLGFLSLRISWGIIIWLTLAALLLSVPPNAPRRRYWLAVALLVTSYPALRNYADANVEAVLILGILLLIFSCKTRRPYLLGLSLLLATIKPQATFLLMLIVGITLLQRTEPRFWLKTAAVVLAVVIPTLLWAYDRWLFAVQDRLPSGVSAGGLLDRLDAPIWITAPVLILIAAVTLFVAYRNPDRLSRLQVGMLIAGSALASPYTNALSLLSVLALGVVPLLIKRRGLGLMLFALYALLFLVLIDPVAYEEWSLIYSGLLLVVTWGVLIWQVYVLEVLPNRQPVLFAARSTPSAD